YYYFKNKQDRLFQSQVLLREQSIYNIESSMKEDSNAKETLQKAVKTHIEYLMEEQATFAMGARPEQFFSGDELETIIKLRNAYAQYVDQLLLKAMPETSKSITDVKLVRNIL